MYVTETFISHNSEKKMVSRSSEKKLIERCELAIMRKKSKFLDYITQLTFFNFKMYF